MCLLLSQHLHYHFKSQLKHYFLADELILVITNERVTFKHTRNKLKMKRLRDPSKHKYSTKKTKNYTIETLSSSRTSNNLIFFCPGDNSNPLAIAYLQYNNILLLHCRCLKPLHPAPTSPFPFLLFVRLLLKTLDYFYKLLTAGSHLFL
jgi:hypothetical protein